MKLINITFGVLLTFGLLGLLMPEAFGGVAFVVVFKVVLQLYLLMFTAFLVMKRVFFYRVRGDINIVRLVRNSEAQVPLLLYGVVISLLFLVYVYQAKGLYTFDSIMIGILLFYYCTQVFEHGRPSIYLDDYSFSYDDYTVQRWPWANLEKVQLEKEQLRLVGPEEDFELDFNSIDDIDFVRLDDELERSILDGEFASSLTSNDLVDIIKNYATENEVNIHNLDETTEDRETSS